MKKINKRGELTTQQLVTIIILIISFVVILFLIFRLNPGETTDKEICHNSVAMKGQSVLNSGALDCKTSYVCISGGDDCEGFNPSITIDINMNQEDQKVEGDIMKAIADEMSDCWWMFGEGKVDYVGLDVKGTTIGKMNCALCSIISFDEKIQKKEIGNYLDFYTYLKSTNKEGGKSYMYYLYNTNNIDDLGIINANEPFELNNQYVVLTGIADQGVLKKTGNFFFSGFDLFNNIFVSFLKLPRLAENKDYGPIPVFIVDKSKIDQQGCDDFLTKA